eukprot:14811575-Heterocapsa_arctica.AAC.1
MNFIDPRVGLDKPVQNNEETVDKEQQTAPPNPRCEPLLRSESSTLGDWLESIPLENKVVILTGIGTEQTQSPQGDVTPLGNSGSPDPDEQEDTDDAREKE